MQCSALDRQLNIHIAVVVVVVLALYYSALQQCMSASRWLRPLATPTCTVAGNWPRPRVCDVLGGVMTEEQVHRRQLRAKKRREKALEKSEKDKVCDHFLI